MKHTRASLQRKVDRREREKKQCARCFYKKKFVSRSMAPFLGWRKGWTGRWVCPACVRHCPDHYFPTPRKDHP